MTDVRSELIFFRAVCLEELEDIQRIGGFRPSRGTMETKLFTVTLEDAADLGRALFALDQRPFDVIEARIPASLASLVEYLQADGREVAALSPERLEEFNQVAVVQTMTVIPCGKFDA